ncbi:MAG: hypothetical protein ABIS67_00320 [Candidatus Eisenbacteria bacterium]
MIEIEELARCAAPSAVADEGALATVAFGHRASNVCGNMARVSGRAASRSRLRGRRELALLEFADERIECSVEDLRDIPRGKLVAEQILGAAQLVVRSPVDRDLQREALGGERSHFCAGLE